MSEKGKVIEDMVNNMGFPANEIAWHLSHMHRHLIQEFMKMVFKFINVLAHDYAEGYYDGRNEWACKTASIMMKAYQSEYGHGEAYDKSEYENTERNGKKWNIY